MAPQLSSPPPPPFASQETPSSSPNPPQTPSESTTIHSLPAELLLLVASHLTYPSTPLLRFTHPFFYYALPATPPTHTELRAAELSSLATTLGLLGCTGCLRMLPARWFRRSQSALARGRSPNGRQCYRCECQCLQKWHLCYTMPLLDIKPQEARVLEPEGPEGRTALRVKCRLCCAPLRENEALKRKRWGYCEGCAKVGSAQTVRGVLEPVSVEEWGRRWMGWKRGG
ncbi:hypothetical protein MMC17_000905 [Xylographa soralifera]|nr:hypothetical protein [Xylographa soralifera]